ncbi:MAG: polysaccharide deacetylase family protein [Nitrospira sp.]
MNVDIWQIKAALRKAVAWAFHMSPMPYWRHRGKVVMLMYHRVLARKEVSRQSVQPGMYVLDNVFAQQISFLKDNFTLLSLQQLLDLWQSGTWNARARYCVVTFDDGWLDNYRYAYPVLKKYGIPATIFLPTDYVGSDRWFWPDQLALLFKVLSSRKMTPDVSREVGKVFAEYLDHTSAPFIAAMERGEHVTDQVIEQCKHLPIERIQTLVDGLAIRLDVSLPQERVIVNWDEVREMSQGGVSFGSHSCSHRILTTITSDDVSVELTKSRQVLLEQGVNYVPVFCYPNGNSDERIQRQVQACGYEAACSVTMGVEGPTPENKYAIRRVGIHNDITNTIPLFSWRMFGPLPGSA